MDAAKKWLAANNNNYKAEPYLVRAIELAANDKQKLEPLLIYAKNLELMTRKAGSRYSTKVFYRSDEAYQKYKEAEKLSTANKDEIRLAIASLASLASFNSSLTPDALRKMVLADSKEPDLLKFAQAEYTKLIDNASVAPGIRAKAYIGRAKTRGSVVNFGGLNKDVATAKANDLKAAATLPGAPDEVHAEAYFEIVDFASQVKDINSVAGAYDAITKLPKATNAQKIKAYESLVYILVQNRNIKLSRDELAAANKLVGLTTEQKATLLRMSALTFVFDADPSDPKEFGKAKKKAIAELDKSVKGRLTDDEKFKIYLESGEFLGKIGVACDLAVDQLEKAIKLKQIKESQRAEAQYQIGEAYRQSNRNDEAIAAYLKVSEANPQYRNYARQRLNQVDPTGKYKQ
ncbi:MAG: hypothetical protein UZ17_ACD001000730 [Acidobacteria bacterium OLB17]|nr:MAG: hypothetical protein UZ17_ACD001000730 [Acidobacteria bacterium OLB17]MCZ2391219.1 tetratricopeptide repeat protein [Acidobacteriota bacterium]